MSSVNESDCRGDRRPAGSEWASLVFAALYFSTPLATTRRAGPRVPLRSRVTEPRGLLAAAGATPLMALFLTGYEYPIRSVSAMAIAAMASGLLRLVRIERGRRDRSQCDLTEQSAESGYRFVERSIV